jgi:hypothetical protein
VILEFAKPDRICIVDRNGTIVRLNDSNRTELRFDASERVRARRILNRLNTYQPKSEIGPFRLLPLVGEPAIGQVRE